jgi:hypothetical protein
MPIEEIKLIEEPKDKKKGAYKKKNMEKYAPVLFEECFIKDKGMTVL